jgi:hypothetical protein
MTFNSFQFQPNPELSNDGTIINRMKQFYEEVSPIQTTLWNEADVDQRFAMNDQSLWSRIYAIYPLLGNRTNFTFNYIARYINYLVGSQSQNRKQSICIPQEDADQETADQYTKFLIYTSQMDNESQTITDFFEMMITTGVGYLHTWLDYRHDPINGRMRTEALPYSNVIIDPYYRDYKNLSDCNEMWMRRYISYEEAIQTYKKKVYEIDSLNQGTYRDEKFIFMQESYNQYRKKLYTLDLFYYLTSREATLIIDTTTGESMEWKKDPNDPELKRRLANDDSLILKKTTVPTINEAHVMNNQLVLYHGRNRLNIDRYNIIPGYCYFNQDSTIYSLKVQGIVRKLRDVNYLYNHRKRIELDMLESLATTGMKVMEGSLVDDSSVFNVGQGRMFYIKKTAKEGMNSIQPIQQPTVDPSAIQISQMLTQDMEKIVAISEESMGLDIKDKAAVITRLRQLTSQTAYQKVFDNLDVAQKMHAQLKIDIAIENWSPGKIKAILKEEPTDYFFSTVYAKYSTTVTNGYDTPTQRQMTALQLFNLHEMGYPIPVEAMLDSVDIQDKKKLQKQIEQEMQSQQQSQQTMQQIQLMQLQMQAEALKAKANADNSLALERTSRVDENESLSIERLAQAQADRDRGILDKVKATKEIAAMDVQHLHDALDLLGRLNEEQAEQEEGLEERKQSIPRNRIQKKRAISV